MVPEQEKLANFLFMYRDLMSTMVCENLDYLISD